MAITDEKQSESRRFLMGKQPLYGFIQFELLGERLSDFKSGINNCVMDLTVQKIQSKDSKQMVGTTFTVNLYDDTALLLEYKIAKAMQSDSMKDNGIPCRMRYGWSGNDGNIIEATATMDAIITKYNINFEGPTTTLELDGTTTSTNVLNKSSHEFFMAEEYGGIPSKIVRAICEGKGIKEELCIETEPIYVDGTNKPRTFAMNGKSYMSFINTELAPKSKPAKLAGVKNSTLVGYDFTVNEQDNTFKFIPKNYVGYDAKVQAIEAKKPVEELYQKDQKEGSKEFAKKKNENNGIHVRNMHPNRKVVGSAKLKTHRIMGVSENIEDKELEKTNTGNTNNTDTQTTTKIEYGKVIFMGDKRVESLSNSIPENEDIYYVYDGNADIDWLVDLAIPYVKKMITIGYKIFLNIGINDTSNVVDYIYAINNFADYCKDKDSQLYVVSLNPVYSKKSSTENNDTLSNTEISNFNNTLQMGLNDNVVYIDTYAYIKSLINEYNTDSEGVLYTSQINQGIYNKAIVYYDTKTAVTKQRDIINNTNIPVQKKIAYEQAIENTERSEINKAEAVVKMAISIGQSEQKDIAEAKNSLEKLVSKDDGTYANLTGSLMKVINPTIDKTSNNSVGLYGNILDSINMNGTGIVSTGNKDNKDNEELINTVNDALSNKLENIFKDKGISEEAYAKAVVGIIGIINTGNDGGMLTESAKQIAIDRVKDSIGLSDTSVKKLENIFSLGDKADRTTYEDLGKSLLQDIQTSGKYGKVGDIAGKAVSLRNIVNIFREKDIKNTDDYINLGKGILDTILPNSSQKTESYINLGKDIYSNAKNWNKDSIYVLTKDLGDVLNIDTDKVDKVKNYVKIAQDLGDIFSNKDGKKLSTEDTILNVVNTFDSSLGSTALGSLIGDKAVGIVKTATSFMKSYKQAKDNVEKMIKSSIGNMTNTFANVTKDKLKEGTEKDVPNSVKDEKTEKIMAYYEYYCGDNQGLSDVISFNPQIMAIPYTIPKSTVSIDRVRNEMIKCVVGNDTKSVLIGSGIDVPNNDTTKNAYQLDCGGLMWGLSGDTYKNLEDATVALWVQRAGISTKATLTVMGDTRIKQLGYINLSVYTKYGFLHHTSGRYMVKSITDTVQDGMFTTEMELQKGPESKKGNGKGEGAGSGMGGSGSVQANGSGAMFGFDQDYLDRNNVDESVTNLQNVQPIVKKVMNDIAQEYYDKTGNKLMITGGAELGIHEKGEWGHEGGWKLDIATDNVDKQLFFDICRRHGVACGHEDSAHYDLGFGVSSGIGDGYGGNNNVTHGTYSDVDNKRLEGNWYD